MTELKPSMYQSIVFSFCALLSLAPVFYGAYGDPPISVFTVFILVNFLMIAIAIYSWISYFKAYIRYEIESSLIKKE